MQVSVDEANKTITITDNGIGMSREDAISHLGTIARSGTAEFLKVCPVTRRKTQT